MYSAKTFSALKQIGCWPWNMQNACVKRVDGVRPLILTKKLPSYSCVKTSLRKPELISCIYSSKLLSLHLIQIVGELGHLLNSKTNFDKHTDNSLIWNIIFKFRQVPKLKQKIAGKSIPIEKFAVRKAQRYLDQGEKLVLPALVSVFCYFDILVITFLFQKRVW